MMWRLQKSGSRGQALVEFALVLPVLLLLVFGLIDAGRYVYLTNAFNQAAREGARFGSVEQWQFSCPMSVPVAQQDRFKCTAAVTTERVAGAPAFVQPPSVVCLSDPSNPASAVLAPACRAGYLLKVTISTPTTPANQQFHFFTPVIGQLLGTPVIAGTASVVVQ